MIVRTVSHCRHFPDLPGREITIEGNSIVKHCTTQQQKEKSKMIQMGWKKEEMFKNIINANKKQRREKETT